jgi:hypothetical protein
MPIVFFKKVVHLSEQEINERINSYAYDGYVDCNAVADSIQSWIASHGEYDGRFRPIFLHACTVHNANALNAEKNNEESSLSVLAKKYNGEN